MFDLRLEKLTYVFPGHQKKHYSDLHDRVFGCCMHYREDTEVIEEAENVILLKQAPRQYHPEGIIHVWIYLEAWSSCRMYPPSVWDLLTMPQKMEELQHRLSFLRSRAREMQE